MSAPRPYGTDPFRLLGSICNIRSLLYLYQSVTVISSKCNVEVCLSTVGISQLRMCISNTQSPRLRTIIQVILTSTLYVLVGIETKHVEFFHAPL